MAETFTVDTTPQTETVPDSLTAEEQDSLAVGEEMAQQQERLSFQTTRFLTQMMTIPQL